MSKYVIDSSTLTSIGDAIRFQEGTTEPIPVHLLYNRILALETGGGGDLPEEAFNITGDCSYRLAYNGWNWFIDTFKNKIKTQDVTNLKYMFSDSSQLAIIPFEINCKNSIQTDLSYMFANCTNLTEIPKIKNCVVKLAPNIFTQCRNLREIKEEAVAGLDWSYIDSRTSQYDGDRGYTFNNCYSLRSFPMSFLAHGNPYASYSYSIYNSCFTNCYALDEIVDLPVMHRQATWNQSYANAFNNAFTGCSRLKKLTFETDNGEPIKIDTWSKQTIDLTNQTGWNKYASYITGYNNGIGADMEVKTDDDYARLKNSPDWFTTLYQYSRYNYLSLQETLETLPDLSGGAGGNVLKLKRGAGMWTDGGDVAAIENNSYLLGIASAKGWTISLS